MSVCTLQHGSYIVVALRALLADLTSTVSPLSLWLPPLLRVPSTFCGPWFAKQGGLQGARAARGEAETEGRCRGGAGPPGR